MSQDLAKLFDISQFHTTTGTAEEEGSGFGLLIWKEFVEKNGGKIWAKAFLATAVNLSLRYRCSLQLLHYCK